MKEVLREWKDPTILLTSIGLSSIGDFIYLVAINIVVFQLTGSASAVAGLWIIGPLTSIVTKFWVGSFIDYRSKRKIMITTYILRAIFTGVIPFAPNMIVVYLILIVLSVAKAFFNPSSMTYVTILIPEKRRKRFNSIRSFATSGAVIVGPAVGGVLISLISVEPTLWINVLFFMASALLLLFLPEKENIKKEAIPTLTVSQVIHDFTIVRKFMLDNVYVSFIYLGFNAVMVFSFAMDAQEVVFIQQVIGLSELDYSLLISITGTGSVIGAILLSFFPINYLCAI